jgi:hypothetical protein
MGKKRNKVITTKQQLQARVIVEKYKKLNTIRKFNSDNAENLPPFQRSDHNNKRH